MKENIETVHFGWSVAVTAWRETEQGVEFRTRAYGVGTHEADDAIEYAREESAKLWPPALGWEFQFATFQLARPVAGSHEAAP